MTEKTGNLPNSKTDAASSQAESAALPEINRVSAVKTQSIKWLKRITYRIYRLTIEAASVVLGLAFIWLCVVNILIAQRVTDLSFMKADAARSFSKAFDGKNADVGNVSVAWEAADNTLIFRADDISVAAKTGEPLNALTYVETEVALRDIVQGKIDPIRVVVDGGELSFLRDAEGNFIAGLGTPETAGQFGPVWRGERNDGDNDLEIGRIRSLKIENAKIYVRDAGTEYAGVLDNADFDVAFVPDAIIFDMSAELSRAGIEVTAPLNFKGRVSPDLQNVDATFTGESINPSQILPEIPALQAVLALDAQLDMNLRVLAGRETGLQTLDIDVDATRGKVRRNDKSYDFNSASLAGQYNPAQRTLNLTSLNLQSELLSAAGQAQITNLGATTDKLFAGDISFDAELNTLNWNGVSIGIEPVAVEEVKISGQVIQNENILRFDRVIADFGTFKPDLKGSFTRNQTGKPISASLVGTIEGVVNRDQLLALWPQTMIRGARNWVEGSIVNANLSNFDIRLDADEAILAGEPLKNPDLTMTFDLREGVVKYISTMTPAEDVVGRGRLLGNQVEFTIQSGRVADVMLDKGKVSIPRIYPYGGALIIEGEGRGPVTTLVGLLDQKPFEYVSPYGVDPSGFDGTGQVKLSVTRPLRSKITYEQVDFDVSGTLSDVSAPFSIGQNKLTNGEVSLLADREGLTVQGPVNIGPWQANLLWQEVFDNGATPTRYKVNGPLSQSELDSFGIGLREFIGGGDINLSIDAQAEGITVSRAEVVADLSQTNMRVGPYWDKPVGVNAKMTGVLSYTEGDNLVLNDVRLTSPGLNLEGSLDIGTDMRLRDLNLTRAEIDGFINAALHIKPSPAQDRFDIYITGKYLDISPMISNVLDGGSSTIDVPLLMTGALERLVFSESYTLQNTNILYAHNGVGSTQARLKGETNKGDVTINLNTPSDAALRTLEIDIPDASAAAFAFFDLRSLNGGRLQMNADLPAVGEEGPLTGTMTLEDVTIVNAPIMTTMLSLASLQGLVDALGGEGLKFEQLEMPFSYENNRLSVRDARASGPGLGMTANGEIDISRKLLDIDGALVPAYTANSMLGEIPIIGDIFVGKKGEGVFALNYSVGGEFEKAQVAVNPLSALTPGFLRGIFSKQRDDLPEGLREQIEAVRPATDLPIEEPADRP